MPGWAGGRTPQRLAACTSKGGSLVIGPMPRALKYRSRWGRSCETAAGERGGRSRQWGPANDRPRRGAVSAQRARPRGHEWASSWLVGLVGYLGSFSFIRSRRDCLVHEASRMLLGSWALGSWLLSSAAARKRCCRRVTSHSQTRYSTCAEAKPLDYSSPSARGPTLHSSW